MLASMSIWDRFDEFLEIDCIFIKFDRNFINFAVSIKLVQIDMLSNTGMEPSK